MNSPRRVLLTLEYDGTRFSGWQRQINGRSVQEEVETALLKATRRPLKVTGASRTDAGVHALGQRAHFDTDAAIPDGKWPFVLNTLLPPDIRATGSLRVNPDLHARFSAIGKEYRYRILNRSQPGALLRHFAAFVPLPLCENPMREALATLAGRHDFKAFQAAGGSAKTTVRTLYLAGLERQGEEWTLTVSGDAFLYNMVRIIAGTLIQVGLGKLPPDAFRRAFETGDRLALGPTAPARGLTLMKVDYEGLP